MRPDLGQQNCKFISRYIKYSKYSNIFGLKTFVTNHVKACFYDTYRNYFYTSNDRNSIITSVSTNLIKNIIKYNLPEYVALINRNPIIDRLNSLQVIVLE